jgi:CRP-like cAMP-binding protein
MKVFDIFVVGASVALSYSSKELIRGALAKNEFLEKLEKGQVADLVDCMVMKEFKKDQYIIRQGLPGDELFVIQEGLVEVIKDSQKLHEMGVGIVFGELAILYNCKRTAHVKALMDTKVWALQRRTYQIIMQRTNKVRQQEYIQFLKSCDLFKSYPESRLARIADALEEV